MTTILLVLVVAAAVILAGLLTTRACFETQLDDLDTLRAARSDPARWLH